MPELQITDSDGCLDMGSRSRVFARMLYPDDEDRRNDYETILIAQYIWSQHENDGDEIRGLSRAALGNLIIGPGLRGFVNSLSNACFWGETVGDLVLALMLLKKEIGKRASLNKAIKVIQHRAARDEDDDWPDQLRSISAIKKHWAELKPVAHLWAAYVATGSFRWDPEIKGPKPVHFATEEDYRALLCIAEAILAWGARHISERQGPKPIPLLDPETAWRVPSDLELEPPSDYLMGFEYLSPEEVSIALDSRKK